MWAHASLRTRVLLLAVGLATVGLLAFSVTVNTALRGYLQQRLDTQLGAAAQVISHQSPAATIADARTSVEAPLGQDLFGDVTVAYLAGDGTVTAVVHPIAAGPAAAGPALPALDSMAVAARAGRPFTVTSRDGRGRWRAIALPQRVGGGGVIMAISMSQTDAVVDRMWALSLSAGLLLLCVLSVAGWFAVRSGLRPLVRIEETAGAIADGDLSYRIPDLAAPTTEIGRLTAALNGMLTQIEHAFTARAESEARMGRFVADASHELRTPLVGIRGFADLYRMGALPERSDVDRTMGHIAREAERLTRLVEDMLLLARLDEHALRTAGADGPDEAFPLDLAPMDLRTLAADALHDVRALDPSRPVRLTGPGDGTASSAPALADEARLRQVVTNLVGNAITHTPAATAIRIGVGIVGRHAILEIADHGPGLTPEEGRRIFERFYRADHSRTRATGAGAGLGLAIVHSLVTAHGGRVDLHTAPGAGATFRILLPRQDP